MKEFSNSFSYQENIVDRICPPKRAFTVYT